MKKIILSSFVLLSTAAMAQFNQSDEPAILESQLMYVCDSFTPTYPNATGTGQVWDFTWYGQEGTMTRNLNIKDPSATSEGASFPTATKAYEIENYITSYMSSSSASLNCKGFSFVEPTFGTVNVIFSTNDEKVMEYPFDLNDAFTDIFSGQVVSNGSTPVNTTCTGHGNYKVDGSGTIKLNPSTTLTNVLRYKLMDTVDAVINFVIPVKMVRTQYEYYQLSTSSLPVFIHTSLTVTIGGAPQTISLVLNSVQPSGQAGVADNTLNNLTVYPNPATDQVTVAGLTADANCVVTNAEGKVVTENALSAAQATFSVEALQPGVYFLQITSEGLTTTERVVIR